MFRQILNKAVVFGLIFPQMLFACGPGFPNSYLDSNGDKYLLQSPRFNFYDEIDRVALEIDESSVVFNPERAKPNRLSIIQAEVNELRQCLEAKFCPSKRIEQTITEYEALRKKFEKYSRETDVYQYNHSKGNITKPKPKLDLTPEEIPELVPKEFALYLEGAFYYRVGQRDKAARIWQKILDLPASQRHYKSTWAAYMLAKCFWQTDKEKALTMFRQVRQYVREGFADCLDLAASSYGDEAGIYFCQEQYEKAAELYLIQNLTGDRTAKPSLKQVCYAIFNKSDQLDLVHLVKNRMVRQLLLAYAITCSGSEKYDAFISKEDYKLWSVTSQQLLLAAIERANIEIVEDADRLAAIAYRAGDFKQAKRWLNLAEPHSLVARRIRAKLFLRDGKIKEAAEDLAFIARQTDPGQLRFYADYDKVDNSHNLHSELGSLYVSGNMYVKAVDALIKGGNWMDAAYIAERVLKPEELQEYVDNNWSESMVQLIKEDGFQQEGLKALKIRHLLARRLSRHERYQQARPYYPKELLKDFDTFTDALSRGNNTAFPQNERADAFWTAAWLVRHKGMEFIGTELGPDGYIWEGNFPVTDSLQRRLDALEKNKLNIPTQNEIDRAQLHTVTPDKRFHYRYFASELAWKGAELMPDEDDELARRLCLAGIWHRDRDNKYADLFYKTLVLRCGTTELGKEADMIRWFPKIPDTLQAGEPFKPDPNSKPPEPRQI